MLASPDTDSYYRVEPRRLNCTEGTFNGTIGRVPGRLMARCHLTYMVMTTPVVHDRRIHSLQRVVMKTTTGYPVAWALAILCLQVTFVGSAQRLDKGGDDGAFLGRAEQHHEAGRADDALAELRQAVAAFPESPRPLVAMATVLLEARREPEAVQMLRQAAELHRQHPHLANREGKEEGFGIATRAGLLANLATWLYQTGDSAGATSACEEALLVQPVHARCYYIHGVSMLSSGQWREEGGARAAHGSLTASARLFSSSGDRANALFALGSLQLRAGQMAPAASAFEEALRLAPTRHEVLMRVGEMRSRFARHAAALDAFQAAERLRPAHAEATIQCGNALRRLKLLSQALAKYKEASTLQGGHVYV